MKRIISIALASLLISSCIYEDMGECPDPTPPEEESAEVPVEFVVSSADSTETKSSISASETRIVDINIYAYSGGKLEKSGYFRSVQTFTLSLYKGRSYNLYAISNMGEIPPPVMEEELHTTKLSMGSMSYIEGGFPMSWNQDAFTVSGTSPKVNINLVRLVSRIRFSLDKSEVTNFAVKAVRLCQSAFSILPFDDESKAEAAYEVGNGDYASPVDLNAINNGGTITFYAYENCQGTLLAGNQKAESKIPTSIPANSDLCTYLEMTASYAGEYEGVDVSSDNVKYRFYLGEDNCSNFNVRRNTDIQVKLKVTEDRIFDESWKVSYGEPLPEVSYGLELSQTAAEVGVGATASLSANYYRVVDGTRDQNTDVTAYAEWSSSDESIVTVSKGVVTGVSKGTAVITATYNGYRVTYSVTVTDVITYKLYLSSTSLSVGIGKNNKFTALLGTYTNGKQTGASEISSKCTWTSSDESVATVSSIGLVTGVKAGTVTITAEYEGEKVTGTATVTSSTTYELAINPASMTLNKGGSGTLTAIFKVYVDGALKSSTDVTSNATWTTENTSIIGLSKGNVYGSAAGSAIVTAKYNGYTATASVTVKAPATLTLGWTSQTVTKGKVISNAAIYTPGDGSSAIVATSAATWTTSNAGVATVGGGTITAQGAGTAIITATYNGLSASCTITVTGGETPPANTYVTNMTVSNEWLTGSTYKLKLTLTFSDGTKIEDVPYTWSVNFAQSPNISTGQSGEGPLLYTGGGSTYTMAVTVTTTASYKDSSGNSRKFTTGTSFSHNVDWTP